MIKKVLRSSFASFGVASMLALAPTFFRGLPAQAQIVVDGYLNEYTATTAPRLATGVTGPIVQDLQIFLDELGYYKGAIDGTYDNDVMDAVREFQTDYRLTANGIVDNNTWGKLFGIDENEVFEEEDNYDAATGEYSDYEPGF